MYRPHSRASEGQQCGSRAISRRPPSVRASAHPRPGRWREHTSCRRSARRDLRADVRVRRRPVPGLTGCASRLTGQPASRSASLPGNPSVTPDGPTSDLRD